MSPVHCVDYPIVSPTGNKLNLILFNIELETVTVDVDFSLRVSTLHANGKFIAVRDRMKMTGSVQTVVQIK